MAAVETIQPKVSVIITCYNHGAFLAEAIESVLRQTYQPIEIVVVDDGSGDNTREVCKRFPSAKYVYQENAGLSAARNKGVTKSVGKFLVFLDADDWLYPDAIAINLNYLKRSKHCSFVSGGHNKVDAWGYTIDEEHKVVDKNHYCELLQGNYIGMHAAVMYHRIVFTEFQFDTSLQACEDYDLYLRIARKYSVCSHEHKIAAYRIHSSNMSANNVMMLKNVLAVLQRQKDVITVQEKPYYENGIKIWTEYYCNKMFESLKSRANDIKHWPNGSEFLALARYDLKKLGKFLVKKGLSATVAILKTKLPDTVLKSLHEAGLYRQYIPAPGKVQVGDFERLTPFSTDFGFDRGGAIDRYFIEKFIDENRDRVRGSVLEIGDNEYTLRYGRSLVSKSDILHIDASNEKATFVGDITNVPQIPSGNFDCIIFTQTLHLIYDFKKALETCYRILKPGGCLLLTVPGITPIDKGPWKDYWLWSFTDSAMKRVMQETFNGSELEVKAHGNVHVASAFLYGMGLGEIATKALEYNDPSYQVIVTVKAIKH
jgi:glycosyltransferase involved in cell wall biosynthesis